MHAADRRAVQTVIERLAEVKDGRLREDSILYEFMLAQIDGLTLTNNRGNRWSNRFLFFWLDMIGEMGGRGFDAFRGIPRQLSLPPGQRRPPDMRVSPDAYNFNVPSRSLLYDVGLPETDNIDGFGTREHAEQVVKNILAATGLASMDAVTSSADPATRMQGFLCFTFDGSAIRKGLVVNRQHADWNGGNPFIGYVSDSALTLDGTKADLASHVIKLGCVTPLGLFTEAGSFFTTSETSAQLVEKLFDFVVRLRDLGVTVYAGCSDAANVMKRTLKELRTRMKDVLGLVLLILMDFDHNHKNSRNMLMGRVMMTLTGVMFSILTIRALWLHVDERIRAYVKFLTLQHVAPKNKMKSELARTVRSRLHGPTIIAALCLACEFVVCIDLLSTPYTGIFARGNNHHRCRLSAARPPDDGGAEEVSCGVRADSHGRRVSARRRCATRLDRCLLHLLRALVRGRSELARRRADAKGHRSCEGLRRLHRCQLRRVRRGGRGLRLRPDDVCAAEGATRRPRLEEERVEGRARRAPA